MSYRNPAIIQDTSGQLVTNAITQGIQTIAQGYKEGEAKRERIRLEAKKANDKKIATNIRLEADYQDSILNANTSRKDLGTGLSADAKVLQEGLLQDIYEANQSIYDPNVSSADRRYYSAQRLAYKTELQSINNTIIKIGVLNGEAVEISKDPNVIGKTIGYNDVEGDGGNSMNGMNAAFGNRGNQSLRLKKGVNGKIELVGSGDIGTKEEPNLWNYSVSMDDFNNDDWDTNHEISQLTINGGKLLSSEAFTEDGKTISNQYIAEGEQIIPVEVPEIGADGKPTGNVIRSTRTVLTRATLPNGELNTKSNLEIQRDTVVDGKVADFQAMGDSRADQNSILTSQLGIDPKEYWGAITSGDVNRISEANEEFRTEMEREIMQNSGIKLVEEGGITYLDNNDAKSYTPKQPAKQKAPSQKEKDSYFWKTNMSNELSRVNSDPEYTNAMAMKNVIPTQIGNKFLGNKITDINWGEDSVTITVDEEASDSSIMLAGEDTSGKVPGEKKLEYGNINDMRNLAMSVGGGLKSPEAALIFARQITSRFSKK
tara:strand:- start:3324 stop:4952 length:1629 start_codon:yes stop_codon:yes gene_type:complete